MPTTMKDPRDPFVQLATVASVQDTIDAAGAARAEDDYRRLREHDIISRVAVEVGGWQRLAILVRNLAHYDGVDL